MTALHPLSLLGAALALVGCTSASPDGLPRHARQPPPGRTPGLHAAFPAAHAAADAPARESHQPWLA